MKLNDLKMPEVYDLGVDVSTLVLERRLQLGITQKELAEMIGTKQSSIARLEAGYLPSLSFLDKIAKATGCEIKISFSCRRGGECKHENKEEFVETKNGETYLLCVGCLKEFREVGKHNNSSPVVIQN